MRINWFSPLPPAASGITDYTVQILPELRAHNQVTLWTDQAEWETKLETIAPVRHYDPEVIPWDELNRGDVTVFNITDSPLSRRTLWRVARRHPGIIILHDIPFRKLLLEKRLESRSGCPEKMTSGPGRGGMKWAASLRTGQSGLETVIDEFDSASLPLEQVRGLVVHTYDAFRNLKNKNLWPVCYAPSPLAAPRSYSGDTATLSNPEHTKTDNGRMLEEKEHQARYVRTITDFIKEACSFGYPVANYLTARWAGQVPVLSRAAIPKSTILKAAREIAELCNSGSGTSKHFPEVSE